MLRFLATLFAALAAAVLLADVWPLLTGSGQFRLSALGEWWFWIDRDSLQVLQPAVERHLSPALWDPGIQTLLEWPLAIELAALAAVFWLLRRRPPARPQKRDGPDFSRR